MAAWWEQYIPYIQQKEKQTGIPTAIVLSQLILESGANSPSGLAKNNNNLFGMKGTGTRGTASHVTHEFVNGKYVTVSSGFANYNTPYDSIDAYINLIQKPRYATKVAGAKTLNEFAQGIKNGGYATDPSYVSKLMKVVNDFSLDKYQVNKSISFIPNANYGEGVTGLTDTAFGLGGGNLLQPLTDFFKSAEINFLKVTVYLTLFIIFIWFFYQAISKEPTIQAATQQTQKITNTTRKVVRKTVNAPAAAANQTAAATNQGTKKAASNAKKLLVAAIKYIPK